MGIKNYYKKIVLLTMFFLALCIFFNINNAYAVSNYTLTDTITASLDNGVLTISGTGAMPDYGKNSNQAPWKSESDSITNVVINSGITEIGENSFYDCTSISSVSLPDSLKIIASYAFSNCEALENITFNEGLENIESYGFYQTSLKTVTLPASLTRVGVDAFSGIEELAEYIVTPGNTEYYVYDGGLYWNPTMYTNHEFVAYPPASTKTEYTIKDGVDEIGQSAFYKAKNLKTINIPDSIESISAYAFKECGITSIVIPEVILDPYPNMFDGCASLERVEFNATVEGRLPSHTFSNLPKLKEVIFKGPIQEFYANCFENLPLLERVVIPEGSEMINFSAFTNCPNLKEVVWADSLVSVSETAFEECDSLIEKYPEGFEIQHDGYYRLPSVQVKITGTYDYEKSKEVFDLINEERTSRGLEPVVMDKELFEAAQLRAAEIAIFYSHTRPDGSSCFSIFPEAIYDTPGLHVAGGENITAGRLSAESAMDAWMNSPGHRSNILMSSFTSVGVGCFYHDGAYYWVQCFTTGRDEEFDYPQNEEKQVTINVHGKDIEYTINEGSVEVGIGEEALKLKVYGTYESLTEKSYKMFVVDNDTISGWEVEDTNIAAVDENGNITPKGIGNTVVKVTSPNGDTLSANVKVFDNNATIEWDESIADDSLIDIIQGYPQQLKVKINSDYPESVHITWSVSNPYAATVDENGVVTAIGHNQYAYVYAKIDNGYTISKRIFVMKPIKVSSIYLGQTSVTLSSVGEETTVRYVVLPTNATVQDLTWSSSNENVAKVDNNGKVTAVSNGTVTITVAAQDGSGVTNSFNVTVNINSTETPVDPNEPEDPINPPAQDDELPFIDIKVGAWYYDGLKYLYSKGAVSGTTPTTFSPNQNLSRAMLVTILWNMEGRPDVNGTNKFPDVKNEAWYTDAIIWASEKGVINGYKDGTFAPNKDITREETAAILMNYCKYKGKFEASNKSLTSYSDNNLVSPWAKVAMQWAVGNRVINGTDNGTKLSPNSTATRAEAITMIHNYCKNIGE